MSERPAPPTSMPPLNALRAFEVAARHGSFKRAADELSITPSAVSHQIAALEERLGAQLFQRSAGRVSLSEEGGLRPAGGRRRADPPPFPVGTHRAGLCHCRGALADAASAHLPERASRPAA